MVFQLSCQDSALPRAIRALNFEVLPRSLFLFLFSSFYVMDYDSSSYNNNVSTLRDEGHSSLLACIPCG